MTPKQLFSRVRMDTAVNDMAAVKFSDYQMLSALNSVLSIIYSTVSTMSSTLLDTEATIRMKNGKGELPDDFLQAVLVTANGTVLQPATKTQDIGSDTYRIVGNTIRSDNASLTIEYKPFFEELEYTDTDDDLELPSLFNELLRSYMITVLLSGAPNGELVQKVTTDVCRLVANREFTALNADVAPVWKV